MTEERREILAHYNMVDECRERKINIWNKKNKVWEYTEKAQKIFDACYNELKEQEQDLER